MRHLLQYLTILFILLSPILFSFVGMSNLLLKPRVRIESVTVDLKENEPIAVGCPFTVSVTMTNMRFIPVRGELHVYLTALGLPQKEIGNLSIDISRCGIIQFLVRENKETFKIPCNIDWLDASWYQQTYNIKVIFYKEQFFGSLREVDCSTTEGIQVISPFWEKDKISIIQLDVPEQLENPQQDTFFIKALVFNGGQCEMQTKMCVYLIEKPSAIPALDQFGILPGMAAIRKELGDSETWEAIKPSEFREFDVRCYLRDLEEQKERFFLTAVVFANLDNTEYEVYSSDYYEVYHKQPICREEGCWILAGIIIFGGLIAFCLVSISIRILYPMYKIKKLRLHEEKDRIEKR